MIRAKIANVCWMLEMMYLVVSIFSVINPFILHNSPINSAFGVYLFFFLSCPWYVQVLRPGTEPVPQL